VFWLSHFMIGPPIATLGTNFVWQSNEWLGQFLLQWTIIYPASNASSTTTPVHLSFAHVLLTKHSSCLILLFYLQSRLESSPCIAIFSIKIIVCIDWLKLLRHYIVNIKIAHEGRYTHSLLKMELHIWKFPWM
jgi:hypothetical protein